MCGEVEFVNHFDVFEADGFDDFELFEDEWGFSEEGEVGEDVFHDGFL